MSDRAPNFAEYIQTRELLDISRAQLDALDRSRMPDGTIIGLDNFAKLKVSTVFAALAIESALNHFIQIHALLARQPYMQTFVAEVTRHFLWARIDQNLTLLVRCWSEPFPRDLVKDVRRIFDIRNKIIHEKGQIKSDDARSHGVRALSHSYAVGREELDHMLRHHDIATDFLGRFWLPGNRDLQQDENADDQRS